MLRVPIFALLSSEHSFRHVRVPTFPPQASYPQASYPPVPEIVAASSSTWVCGHGVRAAHRHPQKGRSWCLLPHRAGPTSWTLEWALMPLGPCTSEPWVNPWIYEQSNYQMCFCCKNGHERLSCFITSGASLCLTHPPTWSSWFLIPQSLAKSRPMAPSLAPRRNPCSLLARKPLAEGKAAYLGSRREGCPMPGWARGVWGNTNFSRSPMVTGDEGGEMKGLQHFLHTSQTLNPERSQRDQREGALWARV